MIAVLGGMEPAGERGAGAESPRTFFGESGRGSGRPGGRCSGAEVDGGGGGCSYGALLVLFGWKMPFYSFPWHKMHSFPLERGGGGGEEGGKGEVSCL